MEWTYNEPVEGPVYCVVDEGAVANGNHESFAERHDDRNGHRP